MPIGSQDPGPMRRQVIADGTRCLAGIAAISNAHCRAGRPSARPACRV